MNSIRFIVLAIAGALFLPQAGIAAAPVTEDTTKASTDTYIVRFAEPGLLYYTGGERNLAPTAPAAAGNRKLDAKSPAATAYTAHVMELQRQRLDTFEGVLEREVPMLHTYYVAFNGLAIALTEAEALRLRELPEVESIEKAGTYEIDTDAGPTLIGAPGVWTGASMPSGLPNRGENVVIGVLDGGANSDHPSFANDPSCGFSAGTPKQISAVDCSAALCLGATPEDTGTTGHGVHTSSTAGGNRLVPPLTVNGVQLRWEISGVAPCARIRHYKVCPSNSCPGADILSGIQAAITDGVDVVNFSISGGSTPWTDNDRGFLDMVNADILVSASAGNTSATITDPVANVNHRGPWVLTVANSTHDRIEGNPINIAGGPQNVAGQVGANPFVSTVTAQVAVGTALGSEQGCGVSSPYPAGSMAGKIAFIQRGSCNFTEKSLNAQAAGAIGLVLYNNAGGPPIQMAATSLPGAMVGDTVGITMRNFLVANPTAMMTLNVPAVRVTDPTFADVLNASSLRGPNNSFDVTKPDITGPGTNIYAAVSDAGGQFNFLTGTSMSAPHLSGAAALIRSGQPMWTPAEVKSALQLTSSRNGLNAAGLLSWNADDIGNGRVNVGAAVRAGLVMNETFANYLAADPSAGGQPRNLNLPSLRHTTCNGSCTFTRTFRNTKTTATTWNAIVSDVPAGTQVTVSPASFSFTGSLAETQTVTITVAVSAPPPGLAATTFGHLIFRDAAAVLPDARMSVAIRGTSNTVFANGFE